MPWVEHLHIDYTLPGGVRCFLRPEGRNFYSRCINAARACGYDKTLAIEPNTFFAPFREEAAGSLSILREI
jgi:hypothetical protein